MAKLADLIERYLRYLILQNKEQVLEVKRSELAEKFSCAPSQINYVLSTRFTAQRGYLVESKRGEGGYIRIIRVNLHELDKIHSLIKEYLHKPLLQEEALQIIDWLEEEEWIRPSHAAIMRVVVINDNIPLSPPARDIWRANLLRQMIMQMIKFKK